MQLSVALAVPWILAAALATAAPGEWLRPRHDTGRSGATQLQGSLISPARAWTLPVGGALIPQALWAGDVDSFPGDEWLLVEDGRLLLVDRSGRLLWDTPRRGLNQIIGVTDLNGDGVQEVIATRESVTGTVEIRDGRTGELRWAIPGLSEVHQKFRSDTVRLVELDGDGRPELLVTGHKLAQLRAYDLQGGEVVELWTHDFVGYSNYNPPVVGDLDGDGLPEVAITIETDVLVVNGDDGSLNHRFEGVLRGHSFSHLEVADLSRSPGQELLVTGQRITSRNLTVISVAEQRIDWQLEWPAEETKLLHPVRPLGDFDNDERLELVVAVFNDADQELDAAGEAGDHDGVNAPGQWSLLILDGDDGRALSSVTGWIPEALLDLDGDGQAEILARATPALITGPGQLADLVALRSTNDGLEASAPLERARLLRGRDDRSEGLHDMLPTRALVGLPSSLGEDNALAVLRDEDNDGWEDRLLRVYYGEEGWVTEVELELQVDRRAAGLIARGKELLILRSDGVLEQRGPDLELEASRALGGFSAQPVSARIGEDELPRLFFVRSSGLLEARALWTGPGEVEPELYWSAFVGTTEALSVSEAAPGGHRAVLALTRNGLGEPAVQAFDAQTGALLWDYPVPQWISIQPPVEARLGDGRAGVLLRGQDGARPTEVDLRIVALDLETGEVLWDVPTSDNVYHYGSLLPVDLDGDGVDEIVHADQNEVETLSGVDGSSLDREACYGCRQSQLGDLDGDGSVDLVIHEREQLCIWTHGPDWREGWCSEKSSRDEGLGHGSALLPLGEGASRLVMPTAAGSLRSFEGADGALAWDRWLKDGVVLFQAPSPLGGELGSVVAAQLNGGGPPELLVGSAEGLLYCLDSGGGYRWDLDLGATPGEPAAIQLSEETIAVAMPTADGRLQLLVDASLSPPREVREVPLDEDGQPLAESEDIDEWSLIERLGVAWEAVEGAQGYRVALMSENGGVVADWQELGDVQSHLITGLRLSPGSRYVTRVMAVAPGAFSESSPSDGVLILDRTSPSILDLSVEPPLFDPGQQSAEIRANIEEDSGLVGWLLEVLTEEGEPLWTRQGELLGTQASLEQSWDGLDDEQQAVPDGPYRVRLQVEDRAGRTSQAEAAVEVLSTLPEPPALEHPEEGTVQPPDLAFRGLAEPGLRVRVETSPEEEPICEGFADEEGRFSCAAWDGLPGGALSVQARAINALGFPSPPSGPRSFCVQSTPGECGGPDCQPGDARACECDGGPSGEQVCRLELGWSECRCEPPGEGEGEGEGEGCEAQCGEGSGELGQPCCGEAQACAPGLECQDGTCLRRPLPAPSNNDDGCGCETAGRDALRLRGAALLGLLLR